MQINRLEVKNVGPHAALDLSLVRGLIGVFGPNGAGKSSILNLIYACLSNDFGRFEGAKVDCIHDLADPAEPAYVTIEAEHNGHEFWLRRGLRPAKHELVVQGEKAITDARKIQDRLTRLLGVDGRALDLFVFKEQNRIYDFLVATAGDRQAAFQKLCGTESCQRAYDILGSALKDPDLTAVVEDNSDELASRLAALEARRDALAAEREPLVPQLLNEASHRSARAILRKAERHAQLLEDRALAESRVPALKREAEEALETKETAQTVYAQIADRVDALRGDADWARAVLSAWKDHARVEKDRARLTRERDEIAEELAARPPVAVDPALEAQLADLDAMRDRRATLRSRRSDANDYLAQFRDRERGACPTCGTPVTHLTDTIRAKEALVAQLTERLAELDDQIDAVVRYRKQRNDDVAWRTERQAALAAKAEALVTAHAARPVASREEAEHTVSRYDALVAKMNRAGRERDDAVAASSDAAAALASGRGRLAELDDELEANQVAQDKVDRAQRRLAEHDAARVQLAAIDSKLEEVTTTIETTKDDLERIRVRLRRGRKLRRMASILAEAREVVSRQGLPSRVAHLVLSRLEGAINRDLEMFGAPFWVETNEDLTFTVHKPGHPPEPSGRLSVGQKVILAIPFWFAWRSEVGLLCLDEPTANLDAANQLFLSEALGKLATTIRDTRQVIVVTHADGLRSCFDQIVDLAPAS